MLVAQPIVAINGTVEGPVVVNARFLSACFACTRFIERPLLLGAFGLSLAFFLVVLSPTGFSHCVDAENDTRALSVT